MRFVYRRLRTQRPVASMGGVFVRYKPIIRIRLQTPVSEISAQGLLDTGSDDTVFPRTAAEELGIVLEGLPVSLATGADSVAIPYAIANVHLVIDDGTQGCAWLGTVGFRLDRKKAFPLLGHAGFLQFFTAEFHGDAHEVVLTPNSNFPGTLT